MTSDAPARNPPCYVFKLPFGESADALNGRSAAFGYGTDTTRQGFTGYEKDVETGLNYAQARYYASGMGRFTGVDPTHESGELSNPQTFNRYVYCLNSPLVHVDPDGMAPWYYYDIGKRRVYVTVEGRIRTWNGHKLTRVEFGGRKYIDAQLTNGGWVRLHRGGLSESISAPTRQQNTGYINTAFVNAFAEHSKNHEEYLKTFIRTSIKEGVFNGLVGYGGNLLAEYFASRLVGGAIGTADEALKVGIAYGPSASGKLAAWATGKGLITLNNLEKPTELGWVGFSVQILDRVRQLGGKVHFDLTYVEKIDDVLAGRHLPNATTSQELRFIKDNWSKFKDYNTP